MVELPSAADIVARLGLQPHPEGGHYRETFRDPRCDASGRALSTTIYFLLARHERSHWHRIDAVESCCCKSPMAITDTASGSVLISPPAKYRRPWCPRMRGRPPKAPAPGHWWDAPSHRALNSQHSSWQHRIGRPANDLWGGQSQRVARTRAR
jgi:hypothetical protein